MIDLVLKLIDRLIDLSKRKEEVNRSLFVNFVQPAFVAFEAVHSDYIESLVRYRRRFDDLTVRMDRDHPVFGDLRLDSLKSAHLRWILRDFTIDTSPEKLRPLLFEIDVYLRGLVGSTGGLDLVEALIEEPETVTADFYSQLCDLPFERSMDFMTYESWQHRFRPFRAEPPPLWDPIRHALTDDFWIVDGPGLANVQRIADSEDSERRQKCRDSIDKAMICFQRAFAVISARYSRLRAELLSPK